MRKWWKNDYSHNPYFNRWFSAIYGDFKRMEEAGYVTILILIDGFLQCKSELCYWFVKWCHNPYFNRWFSAIEQLNIIVQVREVSQSLF